MSSVIGALATISSAFDPSLTRSWRFRISIGITDVIGSIDVPVLLVWAADDPISPLPVGEHLAELFPNARLVSYPSDDHWVARLHADDVAREIAVLLGSSSDQVKL